MDTIRLFWASLQAGQLPDLGLWSYIILAGLVAVEGPAATLLGAAAAAAGMMRPVPVFVASAFGNLTADVLWYSLGYTGKINWITRHGTRFGVRAHHVEHLKNEMHRHAVKVLVAAKLTSAMMIPSLIAAGITRVPWRRWFWALFGAEIIWTGSLFLTGYFATHAITRVERGLEYFAMAATAFFILILLFVVRRYWKKRQQEEDVDDISS